ncbi:adhesion domain-containing protein [Xenorhabdus entomophaga]|uniref:adhesion domain-containing protein n=1 Tax=Xenorhabdus entomophaga TaxID=3136257 RepID=UPI0030F3B611
MKTTLKATAEGASGALPEKDKDVTFTVITSPDVSVANYWGHMENTISAGGMTFHRPTLLTETKGDPKDGGGSDPLDRNELWAYFKSANIEAYCKSTRSLKLASLNDVKSVLLKKYNYVIHQKYGWPINDDYYVSDVNSSQERASIYLNKDKVRWGSNQLLFVSCHN